MTPDWVENGTRVIVSLPGFKRGTIIDVKKVRYNRKSVNANTWALVSHGHAAVWYPATLLHPEYGGKS